VVMGGSCRDMGSSMYDYNSHIVCSLLVCHVKADVANIVPVNRF
jgi:hypothetical protein